MRLTICAILMTIFGTTAWAGAPPEAADGEHCDGCSATGYVAFEPGFSSYGDSATLGGQLGFYLENGLRAGIDLSNRTALGESQATAQANASCAPTAQPRTYSDYKSTQSPTCQASASASSGAAADASLFLAAAVLGYDWHDPRLPFVPSISGGLGVADQGDQTEFGGFVRGDVSVRVRGSVDVTAGYRFVGAVDIEQRAHEFIAGIRLNY